MQTTNKENVRTLSPHTYAQAAADTHSFPVHLEMSLVVTSEPSLYFHLLSAPVSFSLCFFPSIHRQNSV